LRILLWEDRLPGKDTQPGFEVHRLKGRLPVSDGKILLLQGVRNIYELNEAEAARGPADDEAKLVLIGRGLDQPAFRESLIEMLA
jgi:G3E family GTPase